MAAEAGVSLKTVSRVVNGEAAVHRETAERVRAAAVLLGFRRNNAASSPARASTQAGIGVVIEDVSDPFYSRLTRGVEEVARTYGHLVLLSSSEENAERERTATLALAARGVAGMIVVPHNNDHRYLAGAIDTGLSVVFVDRPPAKLTADCVLSDNVAGARAGVAHLLGRGHLRIAFVGNEIGVYTSSRRLQGYKKAHEHAGVDIDDRLVVLGPRTEAEATAAVHRLLSSRRPPTAVFTQNNLLTIGAFRAARMSARPVELVGFDDFSMADVLDPPVTVVAQDPVTMGRRAARLLFARLEGQTAPARRVVVPTRLIVRDPHRPHGSTAGRARSDSPATPT